MGSIYGLTAPINCTAESFVGISAGTLLLDLLFPVTGLLLSLVLQVLMLLMGSLRRRVRAAKLFGWIAYVGADIVAISTLAFMAGSQPGDDDRFGLYGLWAALLVHHLGGPDNFTAHERLDSELWQGHLVTLLFQVGQAAVIIAVHSGGWILAPTLSILLVGVIRYWERNAALKNSSIREIKKASRAVYKFMENEGEPSPTEGELNYIVAGAGHWYSTMEKLAKPTGRFNLATSYEDSKPEMVTTADIKHVVTTADIKHVLSGEVTDEEIRNWAQLLVVASASSTAYMRRIAGLCGPEQLRSQRNQQPTRLRSLWFDKLPMDNWIPYLQTEQDFLYSYLYTKAADPEGNRINFIIRVISSLVLVGSLLVVILLPARNTGYNHRLYEEYRYHTIWKSINLFKVSTYFALLVGALVEIGYVVRLFFSKGAVVASLVHLVRSRKANGQRAKCIWVRPICDRLYSVEKRFCVCLLTINKFWESKFVMRKKTYVSGSSWEKGWWIVRWVAEIPWVGFDCRSLLIRMEDYIYDSGTWERGWEMVRMALPAGTDCRSLLHRIEESQSAGVAAVLLRIKLLTDARPGTPAFHLRGASSPNPGDLMCMAFSDFYESDWEHVLLIWWLSTLKVLSLQEHSLRNPGKSFPIYQQYRVDDLRTHFSGDLREIAESNSDDQAENGLIGDGRSGNEGANEYNSESQEEVINEGEGESEDPDASVQTKQMMALWLMVYVCHLLTVCPELLPTQLDLTKSLVAKSLAEARKDIHDPSKWVRKAMEMGHPVDLSDVQHASSQLALKLVTELDGQNRWDLLSTSACHFIAILAQEDKIDQHCRQLTQGGELLTTLWILSSHLGSGQD